MGYLYSFWIYEGKERSAEKGLSASPGDVVTGLVDTVLPNHRWNRIVIADSFFGSLQLAEDLNQRGWKFILASRLDRPTHLFANDLARQLPKGQWKGKVNPEGGILAVCFHDTKKVCFFDKTQLMLQIGFFTNCETQDATAGKKNRQRPKVAQTYNKHMHGVDKCDSFANYKLYTHRHHKWTRAVLFSLFKHALANAWLLFASASGRRMTQRSFLESILPQSEAPPSRSQAAVSVHGLVSLRPARPCQLCRSLGIHSRAAYECAECKVPLHAACEFRYHQQLLVTPGTPAASPSRQLPQPTPSAQVPQPQHFAAAPLGQLPCRDNLPTTSTPFYPPYFGYSIPSNWLPNGLCLLTAPTQPPMPQNHNSQPTPEPTPYSLLP